MEFGICSPVEGAEAVRAAGWDFIEESVQGLLQGTVPDAQWKGIERTKNAALPIHSANMLVPGNLPITGPAVDLAKLREYITRVLSRAHLLGLNVLVFGSAGARNVPDGFSRKSAERQIVEFASMLAPLAQEHDVIVVAEALHRPESNIINTIPEAMQHVQAVNHPNFQCLFDSYHFWMEDEPLENLRAAVPWIKHVHLADKSGRLAPGESRQADYRPVFKILKEARYSGRMSVEAMNFDIPKAGPRVLKFLRNQWENC